MNATDPTGCFERLGLAPDADARAIKRAYARELRRIDTNTELERFARLRQDYEQALEMAADARSSFEAEAEAEAEPETEALHAQGEPEPKVERWQASEAASEPEPQPASAPQPEPRAQPAADPVSNEELLARVEHLATFAAEDVPAALMVLRRIVDMEVLASLSRRDAFEAALVHALYKRRFGARNGALLLAADQVFGWRADGARHLARMGLAGSLVTAVLDEVGQTSTARVERMLALAGEPTPARALKLWKPAQPIDPQTPLAIVLYPPGHLDRWIEAHAKAPVAGRAKLALGRLARSTAMWRVALMLLIVPVAIGIFSVVSSRVEEGQIRKASLECQRAFASASAASWKNMALSQIAMVQLCAAQVPPERCVDREGLATVTALADRLFPSSRSDFERLPYFRFMSYDGIRLNLDDGRMFGILDGARCESVESFLSTADWLGPGDEPAARHLIESAARCVADRGSSPQGHPALYAFLRHTDAWPATEGDVRNARYRLRDLLGQPRPLDTYEASAKLQSKRPWGSCQAY